jgi:hypothetical protein
MRVEGDASAQGAPKRLIRLSPPDAQSIAVPDFGGYANVGGGSDFTRRM